MKTTQASILILTYSINFCDADDGDCFAGDGQRIISVHANHTAAEAIAAELNSIISEAEKETTIWPIQANNKIIKARLGFALHDINDGYNFKLIVETFDIQ